MRIKHLFIIAFTAFFLCTGIMINKAQAIEDAIIAIVNDEVITLRDLRDFIRTTYIGLVAQGYPESRIKQIMLELEINGINKLIEDKLMLSKANSLNLKVNENSVNEKVKTVKDRYVTEEEFTQSLINHGANITDLRNKIKDQLKIKYVVDYEVRSKIYVNPKAVTSYYNDNKDQFIIPEQRILNSIFIPYQSDPDQAKASAQEALDAINSGESFDEVARKYSVAPPIGRIQKGQLMPSIETNVYKLDEGGISNLIELDNGIYIIKITDIIPEHTAKLSEVKDNIKNILFNKKFDEKFNKWMTELKSNAYIEIKE